MAKARIESQIRRLRFDNDEITQQVCYVPSLALAFRIARTFGMAVWPRAPAMTPPFMPSNLRLPAYTVAADPVPDAAALRPLRP